MNGKCNAAPYMGPEKFMYVHCHKTDRNAAYTLIEKLAKEGYRIWYAMPPLNAELISDRIRRCTVFMPLYSQAAAQSHDFRKVITNAVLNGKEIAPVFLENVPLSPGMRLQFDEARRANWYSMREMPDVKAGSALKACKGKPDLSVCVQEREWKPADEPVKSSPGPDIKGVTTFVDEDDLIAKKISPPPEEEKKHTTEFVDEEEYIRKRKEKRKEKESAALNPETKPEESKPAQSEPEENKVAAETTPPSDMEERYRAELERRRAEEEEQKRNAEEDAEEAARRRREKYGNRNKQPVNEPVYAPATQSAEKSEKDQGSRNDKKTVLIIEDEPVKAPEKKPGGTVIIEEMPPMVVRIRTGEVFEGRVGVTTVGRAEDNDICIPVETVSGRHMEIISMPDGGSGAKNLIRDCNSSNGIWIGGEKMERGGKIEVESSILLCLSRPEPCVVLFGDLAQKVRKKGFLACLECRETRESRLLLEDETTFGRNTCWEKGAFSEEHISGEHAVFKREKNGFTIRDISSNGTRINGGAKIAKNVPVKLSSGDEIRMGYQNFVFTYTVLKEK